MNAETANPTALIADAQQGNTRNDALPDGDPRRIEVDAVPFDMMPQLKRIDLHRKMIACIAVIEGFHQFIEWHSRCRAQDKRCVYSSQEIASSQILSSFTYRLSSSSSARIQCQASSASWSLLISTSTRLFSGSDTETTQRMVRTTSKKRSSIAVNQNA